MIGDRILAFQSHPEYCKSLNRIRLEHFIESDTHEDVILIFIKKQKLFS